ncbi:hypothetical protein DND132_2470 [Pseudodesulfovibrio mercurii]|uniref:Uncharacterized protein n=1 Tax=Pseudodesulfovibrio mercurii TaxID=641491 RepID=F0JCJ3_9BACT|nr:hypothetical protein [Pseudodesulfovibrio mercurii]EGB15673.1 hypothetical protein DND132_2470 [Pseudodesulfovibrio mercurii]
MKNLRKWLKGFGFMLTGAVVFGIVALPFAPPHPAGGPLPEDAPVKREEPRTEPSETRIKVRFVTVKADKPRTATKSEAKAPAKATAPAVATARTPKTPPPPKTTRRTERERHEDAAKSGAHTYAFRQQLAEKGKRALGSHGERIGTFPNIAIDTSMHLASGEYIAAMRRIGGRFGVVNLNTDSLVALLDIRAGRLEPLRSLSGMSPKSRFLEGEAWVEPYLEQARREHGPGRYRVALLLPMNVDHYIAGAVEDALGRDGIATRDVDSISGWYRRSGASLAMELRDLRFRNGSRRRVNITIQLG